MFSTSLAVLVYEAQAQVAPVRIMGDMIWGMKEYVVKKL